MIFASIASVFRANYDALVLNIFVGLVFLFSTVRFFIRPREGSHLRMPGVAEALPVSAGSGLLAGLTPAQTAASFSHPLPF